MTMATFCNATKSLTIASAARSNLRRFISLGTVVFFILLVSPAIDASSSNFASAQTQMQLNKEACDEYQKADAEMNVVYRRIAHDYRQSPGLIAALKKAQLAWIRYRNAHLNSLFPGDPSQYGSINPMCRCMSLAEITKARTQILIRWVDGVEEGDVCSGSVKTK